MNRREVLGMAAGAVVGSAAAGNAAAASRPKVGDVLLFPAISLSDGRLQDIPMKMAGRIPDGRLVMEYVEHSDTALLLREKDAVWLRAALDGGGRA